MMAASWSATTAQAAGPPGPGAPPVASQSAAALVAARPAFLHASANESFVQGKVVSSANTQYVPYERTYAGLPVVGGDFVLVVNKAGQVVFSSVAMERPIGTLSTKAKVTQAAAASTAAAQLRTVTQIEGTTLVVHALGATPRLAWHSIVDGIGADGVSRLSVYVDAINGKVLGTRERVMHGTGTAALNGPNPVTITTTQSGGTFSMRDPVVTNLPCQGAATDTTFSR